MIFMIIIIKNMETKRCKKCKEILPISEFNIHASSKDGYQHNCKGCFSSYYHTNKNHFSSVKLETKIKNNKVTAVEFYKNEMNNLIDLWARNDINNERFWIAKSQIYKIARDIEKEQIAVAWDNGNRSKYNENRNKEIGFNYYDLTYNS